MSCELNKINDDILEEYNIKRCNNVSEMFDFMYYEDYTKEDIIDMIEDEWKKKILLGTDMIKEENGKYYFGEKEDIEALEKDILSGKLEAEENFYKQICNKYVETRGEHFIVEDNEGIIHYLELDDSYDEVNADNYKSLLKDGEDTIFDTYKKMYKDIVEYNVYEDLQDKNFGYTLGNFYLSNNELIKLGIDQELNLHLQAEEEEEDCI